MSGEARPRGFDSTSNATARQEVDRLTTALKDAERERGRLRRALEEAAGSDSLIAGIAESGFFGSEDIVRRAEHVLEIAREALQEPAPQGAEQRPETGAGA